MATARFIVNLALRKLGVLGSGREARTSDAADALAALQGLYGSWVATGASGRLRDVVPTGSVYYAEGNERILRESGSTLEVVLPELVSSGYLNDYGHRCCGTVVLTYDGPDGVVSDVKRSQPVAYARTPRDGSAVIITDRVGGNTQLWLYDGTIKAWQDIGLLQLDNEAPRSSADAQGLAACLATEIADQFGSEISEVTLAQASRYKMQMTHRYGMVRQEVVGSYF